MARLHVVERGLHHGVVRRERYLRQRFAGKCDDADAIRLSPRHELLDTGARDFEPVLGLEVEGEHGTRDVERDNDVDAFRGRRLGACPRPRTRECDDAGGEREIAEHRERSREAATGARSTGEHGDARKDDRRGRAPASDQPPHRQQQQEQQPPGRRELQRTSVHHAARSLATTVSTTASAAAC